MAQGLTIDEIIDIDTSVQAGGTISSVFGTGLMMSVSDKLAGSGANKVKKFNSLAEVISFFGASDRVSSDAAAWFGADPSPQALYVGRWVVTADATTTITSPALTGDNLVDLTALDDITAGSYTLNNSSPSADIDWSSGSNADTLSDVASTLQASIRSVQVGNATPFSGAIVGYDSTTLKMTIDFKTTIPVDIGPAPAGKTSFMDALHLTAASGATVFQGKAVETNFGDALTASVALTSDGPPTALMLGSDVPLTQGSGSNIRDTRMLLRNFAQAGDYMCAVLDTSEDAKGSGTGDALAQADAANQSNVIPVYSRGAQGNEPAGPRPDVGILAKLSSQNFDLPQSIITLPPKDLPSVGTTIITSEELSNLREKRASVYTEVGGLPTLLGGFTARDGVWADAQWWLLWLKNEMTRSIFQAMRSSNRLSNAELTDTINDVMAKAVNSGGAQPGGRVSNAIKHDIQRTTGNYAFDGILQTGYVLWIDPPQSQTDADRAARVSRFKIWIAPSEAIHSISSAIILSG